MTERAAAPRSIADTIRALDPDALASLLRARPDLAQPRPSSLAEVTERASTSASTRVALEQLNAWQYRVAEALAAAGETTTVRRLAALLQAGSGEVETAVAELRRRALAWGDDRNLRITHAARTVFGTHPAGLAGASPVPLSDTEIDALLRQTEPADRALLDQLTWGPPTGKVHAAQRGWTLATASSPAERLLALKLLRATDDESVVLPREVALRLRGGRLFADRVDSLVPGWPSPKPSRLAEAAALGSAVEGVQTLTELIEEVAQTSPQPLATGAFARRDLVALAQRVAPDQPVPFWLEVGIELGLLGRMATAWLPTARFDAWAAHSTLERWRSVVGGWMNLSGWPLAGTASVGRTEPAGPQRVRQRTIAELRLAAAGTPVTAALVVDRLAWRHPHWSATEITTGVEQTLREAALLGLVSLGVRTELWDSDSAVELPEPADQVLLQSDLTAVAPGPLSLPVRRNLGLIADRESAGPASVHRFTPASVRRALDAGWSAGQLIDWLEQHSSTPIPQPLRYLVEDAARRHGRVRVRSVGALLTIEDEATLAALLAHPQAAELGLRQVADSLVTARAEASDVVDLLRDLGHAPVAEDESGQVVTTPAGRRARPLPTEPRAGQPSLAELRTLAIELIERGDGAAAAANDFEVLLSTLNQAQGSGDWLRLTHVDDQGRQRTQQVRVMAVVGGQTRLVAKGAGQFVVPISRVVRAVPVS